MAADLEPPKRVFAHGWWTNEGQKISKSIGNIIDPYGIVDKYGIDQIRFFLFREVPFGNDGDFSKDAIAQRINSDLSNNFGNLVQRIFSFIAKNCNSIIKKTINISIAEDKILLEFSLKKFDNYMKYMNKQEIDKAIKEVFELLSEANIYIDKQAPWNLKKTNTERMHEVLYVATEIIKRSSLLLYPIMPSSCEKILSLINYKKIDILFQNFEKFPKNDIHIDNPSPIFPRIENND